MRRTSATHLLAPVDAPLKLEELRCARCDALGVSIVAMQRSDNGMNEAAWCGPDCAGQAGWPFVTSEQRGDAQCRLPL